MPSFSALSANLGRRRQRVLLLPGIGLDLLGVTSDRSLDLLDHLERLLLLRLGPRAHEVGRVAVQRLRATSLCVWGARA